MTPVDTAKGRRDHKEARTQRGEDAKRWGYKKTEDIKKAAQKAAGKRQKKIS